MLSFDNICPTQLLLKVYINLFLWYNKVCWVLQIATLENTHQIFCVSKKWLFGERMIIYQVNMNRYLYPKGYFPSIGTKGESKCFIKTSTRHKNLLRYSEQLLENSVEKTIIIFFDWSNRNWEELKVFQSTELELRRNRERQKVHNQFLHQFDRSSNLELEFHLSF